MPREVKILVGMPENCIPLQLNTVLVAGNDPCQVYCLLMPRALDLRTTAQQKALGLLRWEIKKFQGAAGCNMAAMEAMVWEAVLFYLSHCPSFTSA